MTSNQPAEKPLPPESVQSMIDALGDFGAIVCLMTGKRNVSSFLQMLATTSDHSLKEVTPAVMRQKILEVCNWGISEVEAFRTSN